ncbi:MAG TPA: alpha/beta hydrolase, partial [Candidatus Sulfomarinibacteraceae bacterium]|nr:alpha/beta hydrolase [Candidatus Sulfomarinibacteraceae bacterium]
NLSSATWWEEVMVTLPAGYRGIAPDQRGFGEADPQKKIDATRGLADLADDAIALLDHLGIERAHLAGNSLGGSVMWWLLVYHSERFLTATMAAPGSPYGFGGTKDIEGTPCHDDYAGSGAGLVNPTLVELVKQGDRSMDTPFSPRLALRNLVYKPPFVPPREEEMLSATLAIHVGEKDWPGDKQPSPNWPYAAPGEWGPANALSPKYALDVTQIIRAEPKVPVLWVRGSHDLSVADSGATDVATLGQAGLVPDWPGPDVFPSQPMISQTRAVLEQYAAAGGRYEEVVIEDTGHVPFIEDTEQFNEHFHAYLQDVEEALM